MDLCDRRGVDRLQTVAMDQSETEEALGPTTEMYKTTRNRA